jgi:quercetin dioxygenase-like cupin family protein
MAPKVCCLICAIALFSAHNRALAELEPSCAKDSPERRGEIGCSYVEDKALPAPLTEPLFWHIDRFDSETGAQAAAGPTSVVFQAHGAWWAMSIESTVKDHHSGKHVAAVALPPLPPAPKYSMLVISAYIPAGQTSRVHHHSGVEAFYTVDGEQCLETPTGAHRIPKGSSLAVPAGVTMRLVAAGSNPRRGFAVIVYDASQPPTTRTEELASQLVTCR